MKWMLRVVLFLLVLICLTGCQQQAKTESKDVSGRYSRLVANENIDLQNQLAACRKQISQLQEQLEACKQEVIETASQAGDNIKFLMEQLPKETMEQNTALQKENDELRQEIEQLKKAVQK